MEQKSPINSLLEIDLAKSLNNNFLNTNLNINQVIESIFFLIWTQTNRYCWRKQLMKFGSFVLQGLQRESRHVQYIDALLRCF